ANAIHGIRDRHDFHFVIVVVKIIVIFDHITAIDQFEYIARAYLVATAAANTFLAVQLRYVFRNPLGAAAGSADDYIAHPSFSRIIRPWPDPVLPSLPPRPRRLPESVAPVPATRCRRSTDDPRPDRESATPTRWRCAFSCSHLFPVLSVRHHS